MQAYYEGEHRVIFGNLGVKRDSETIEGNTVDSWADWHLIPTSRPVIAPAPLRKNTVEIPGATNVVDLTEIPRGFPSYGNRTGTLDFYVDHSINWGSIGLAPYDWTHAYSEICGYLNGRKTNIYLADDVHYFYTGRFEVTNWKSDKMVSTITISYDLDPYAYCSAKMFDTAIFNPVLQTWENVEDFLYNECFTLNFAQGNEMSTILAGYTIGNMPVVPDVRWIAPGLTNTDLYVQIYWSVTGRLTDKIKVEGDHVSASGPFTRNPRMQIVAPFHNDYTTFTFFYRDRTTGEFRVPERGAVDVDFRPGRL